MMVSKSRITYEVDLSTIDSTSAVRETAMVDVAMMHGICNKIGQICMRPSD